jgi:hypothetical protein
LGTLVETDRWWWHHRSSSEATDRPDPLHPDVVVALGQQTQHLCVIGRLDRSKPWRAQCGDGDGMGIVGVVLVRPLSGQHPDARGQGCRDIEDLFASSHQLLGQQIAEPS